MCAYVGRTISNSFPRATTGPPPSVVARGAGAIDSSQSSAALLPLWLTSQGGSIGSLTEQSRSTDGSLVQIALRLLQSHVCKGLLLLRTVADAEVIDRGQGEHP